MQMQRLDDVRKYEVDTLNCRDENLPAGQSIDRLNGELELCDVDFGYSSLEKPLINKFSLHIETEHWKRKKPRRLTTARSFNVAGAEGLEPSACGFGDRRSTS